MGSFFSSDYDPLEAKFLGMTFKCDTPHFMQAIKEEFELMFLPYYLFIWVQVRAWGALGIVVGRAEMISESIQARWNSRVNVVTSHAHTQINNYKFLGNWGLEWMVCDPIMFKYWLVHGINRFIPDLVFFGDASEMNGLILDF